MIKLSDDWVVQVDDSMISSAKYQLYHNPCVDLKNPLSMDGYVAYSVRRNDQYDCKCGVKATYAIVKKFKFIRGSQHE